MIHKIDTKTDCRGYYISEIGGRCENQDFVDYRDTPLGLAVVVCDGMGGMNGGSTASSLAVKTILSCLEAAEEGESPEDAVDAAIRAANKEVYTQGKESPELAGMGTTVTIVLFHPDYAVAGFVGDSRIYQFRRKRKVFRTNDHSMVFQMVSAGIITEEQARLSAQSNIIMRALGIAEEVEPDVFCLPYLKGDRFLLCTDGFWGCMSEKELIGHLHQKGSLRTTLSDLSDRVQALGISHGGHHDNYTAALIDIQYDSNTKPKMSKRNKIAFIVLLALLLLSLAGNVWLLSKVRSLKNPVGDAPTTEKIDTATVNAAANTPVLEQDQTNPAGQQDQTNPEDQPVSTETNHDSSPTE